MLLILIEETVCKEMEANRPLYYLLDFCLNVKLFFKKSTNFSNEKKLNLGN